MTSADAKAPAAEGTSISLTRRITNWIAAGQQALSDRAHASSDAGARARGWTVTASTGRFGFGARTYRDPRFDSRNQAAQPPDTARRALPRPPACARRSAHRSTRKGQHDEL